jgi:hypothetical protein
MRHFVITIVDNPKSVEVANRCIRSGAKYGLTIEQYQATTPDDNPGLLLAEDGIGLDNFAEVYSRFENCVAAFHSHYRLWKIAIALNTEVTIFEHDAVVTNFIPEQINYTHVINLGAPSYGRFLTPRYLGVNPLTSKRYFPGAHAYRVNPAGAEMLIAGAKISARPTDVFMNVETFPTLQEYYPWVATADDTFTTIQNINGCRAKHSYASLGENYGII